MAGIYVRYVASAPEAGATLDGYWHDVWETDGGETDAVAEELRAGEYPEVTDYLVDYDLEVK